MYVKRFDDGAMRQGAGEGDVGGRGADPGAGSHAGEAGAQGGALSNKAGVYVEYQGLQVPRAVVC